MHTDDKTFYKNVLDNMLDGVYVVDLDKRILYWNRSAERITGYTADEVVGTKCCDNILVHTDVDGNHLCLSDFICPLLSSMQDNTQKIQEVFLKHKKGHRVPVVVKISPLESELGKIIGAIETFSDNREKLTIFDKSDELETMGLLDKDTGILNRKGIEYYLKLYIDNMDQYKIGFGIMLMKINEFDKIRHKYGHENSGKVTRLVADNLISNLRHDNFPGVWTHEKFAVVLPYITKDQLTALSNRFDHLIKSSRLLVGNDILSITAAIEPVMVQRGITYHDIVTLIDRK
jgi:PAS domain S-box-containing protein/diguanylate cyclase (GGDEF)-like protein